MKDAVAIAAFLTFVGECLIVQAVWEASHDLAPVLTTAGLVCIIDAGAVLLAMAGLRGRI